jgi:DNA invertase Pin-like site-specific DNA recombinase
LTSNLHYAKINASKKQARRKADTRKENTTMKKIAYVRVSTIEQNEARQLEGLKKYNIDKWFNEKCSAKDTNRPQLKAMLDYVREGDTVYIHDFSRIARSTKDLLSIVETLTEKGVFLVSNKEQIDTSTPTGKLMLTMIGAINEFERTNLLERQREGIALAVQEGKYKGRKEVKIDNFAAYYERYRQREFNKAQLAVELNVSRPTLDKLIKEHESAAAV